MKDVSKDSCSVEVEFQGGWSGERGDQIRITRVISPPGQQEPCARKRLQELTQEIKDQGGTVYESEAKTTGTCLLALFREGNVFSRTKRFNPFDALNKERTCILGQVPKNGSKIIKCTFTGRCVHDFVDSDS